MKNSNTNIQNGETFAKAILEAEEKDFALYHQLYLHFNNEMRKAVNHGAICTPERMAALYPIFREINIETDKNKQILADFERRAKRRGK